MFARGMEIWQIVLLVWIVVIPATVIFLGSLIARRRDAAARSSVRRLYVIQGERHSSPAMETARRMRFRRARASLDDTSLPEPVAAGQLERTR
jgi:uncharacterized membrane protein